MRVGSEAAYGVKTLSNAADRAADGAMHAQQMHAQLAAGGAAAMAAHGDVPALERHLAGERASSERRVYAWLLFGGFSLMLLYGVLIKVIDSTTG